MKKLKPLLFLFLSLTLGVGSFLTASIVNKEETKVSYADRESTFPGNGNSGAIMLVNGQSTYFNTGEADLAIYCFNSNSDYAWSDRVDYRVYGDTLRVMLPYKNGQSTTWSKFIICRYNPSMEPAINGWDGVYNQSDDLSFANLFPRGQNTITISGYDNKKLTIASMTVSNPYYGIRGENHIYLDLSDFQSWEEENAKFGIYFACPNSTNEARWGLECSTDGYYASFCWKVNGQDNDHLYECIIPNFYAGSVANIWNMVIAVRFPKEAVTPSWENIIWNKTQNLTFNSTNHTANMIHVDGWDHAELDNVNIISKDDRLEYYGRYFTNTVTCSGDGNSDATTKAMWDAVKFEYEHHICKKLQGEIWLYDTEGKTTLIADAVRRYDYIVAYKGYNHEDYINRHPSDSGSGELYNYGLNSDDNSVTQIILGSIIVLSLMSFTAVTVIKKKKRISK